VYTSDRTLTGELSIPSASEKGHMIVLKGHGSGPASAPGLPGRGGDKHSHGAHAPTNRTIRNKEELRSSGP
jgi:hypothetical protein